MPKAPGDVGGCWWGAVEPLQGIGPKSGVGVAVGVGH